MSVTLSSAGGSQSLVATPSSSTIATKGLTAGSNITLSSDSTSITIDIDPYLCILRRSGNTSVNNTTNYTIEFNVEDYDPHGMHDNSTNPERINIFEDGFYRVEFRSSFTQNVSANGPVRGYVYHVRGMTTTMIGYDENIATSASTSSNSVLRTFQCQTNDYFYALVSNASGANLVLAGGTSNYYSPVITVAKVR